MALDLIVAQLSRLDLFRGLSPEQLQRLADDTQRMVFRDGQKIITAGQASDGAIVLVSGRGMIMPDEDLGIDAEHVEAGTMLSEAATLTEHVCRLTVCAVGDVRAIQLSRDALLANLHDDPDLAERLRARLANRLQRVALELRLIDERLAAATQATLSETATATA